MRPCWRSASTSSSCSTRSRPCAGSSALSTTRTAAPCRGGFRGSGRHRGNQNGDFLAARQPPLLRTKPDRLGSEDLSCPGQATHDEMAEREGEDDPGGYDDGGF